MRSKFQLLTVFYGFIFFALVPINANAVTGSTDYSSVQTSKEKQIEEIRNEEIRAVKSALSLRTEGNRKAELYQRLSELYLESYRADFLLEGRIHEGRLVKNPNARLERGRSLDDLKFGIGSAEQILKLNVEHAKLDQVYYFLAYNYGELHDTVKSFSYYKKLSEEFPESPFASEGIRALADEAFQKGDYNEAQIQYEKALKHSKDRSQEARIYHKLAWCYYRSKRTNDAVNSMKRAISIAKEGGEKLLAIREEGLRDLAIYYAETSRVDEAIEYFKENAGGSDKLARVLEKLGKEYERTGQTEKAIQVYDVLLRLDQKDESALRVAAKLIDLDLLKQNFDAAILRLKVIQIPKSADPETVNAMNSLRKEVRQTGVMNHDRYRRIEDKTKGTQYLKVADQFYSIYLAKFLPSGPETQAERNEIRMYLAEVKKDLNEPGQAAVLYKAIIKDRDEKYGKGAAELWIGSLASELKKRSTSGEKLGEFPSQVEIDFVEASDLLQSSIPNSVESRESRLRSAQILAAYPSQRTDAISRAASLAKFAPATAQGVLAARLWLQLDPSQSTIASLQTSQALSSVDKKQSSELKADLEDAGKKIRVGQITTLEKNKDFLQAGKSYEEYAKTATNEKEAEGAYLGALNAYAQGGKSDEVARVMEAWKLKFPKSSLLEKSVKSQATQFFIKGLFKDSAELFLGIGRQLKDFASFQTSAALFDGGLDPVKAREVYALSLPLAPNEEERAKIYRLSAYVASDQKDDLSALKDWKSCYAILSSLKAECGSQVGNYYMHLNDLRQAKLIFEEIVEIKAGPSVKSPYRAYAQFKLAQILEREMKNAPLTYPIDKLLRVFSSRVEELKPVSNAYQKAIDFGGPWGIAATERLGDLALGLSNEVQKILRDSQSTSDLKQSLTPVADTLKKQALTNSKSAYHLAEKEQLLSSALPVIQDRLVDAETPGMNRAQGARVGIKLIGMSPDGGSQGAENSFKTIRSRLLAKQDSALSWIDYGNLLWGSGKPGLARIAYDRALGLKTRMADALNNVAVVMVSDLGFENWFAANEAVAYWKRAISIEPSHSAANYNLGHFFNYYRLFSLARPYFEKIVRKVPIAGVHDGLGVARWGLDTQAEGILEFRRAEQLGADPNRFTRKYIGAATQGGFACLEILDKLASQDLKGFEKISENRLRERCGQ